MGWYKYLIKYYMDNKQLLSHESTLSSHMRNMIITIGAGITLYNFKKTNSTGNLAPVSLPICLVLTGVILGTYTLYDYRVSITAIKNGTYSYNDNTWYIYVVLAIIQILLCIGFIKL